MHFRILIVLVLGSCPANFIGRDARSPRFKQIYYYIEMAVLPHKEIRLNEGL